MPLISQVIRRALRIRFVFERLQPTAGGALDPTQLALLDKLVDRAAADGLKVVLDPHNYGDAYGPQIGSTAALNVSSQIPGPSLPVICPLESGSLLSGVFC